MHVKGAICIEAARWKLNGYADKLTLVQVQGSVPSVRWGGGDVVGRRAGWGGGWGHGSDGGVTLRATAAALWRDRSPVTVWNLEELTSRKQQYIINIIYYLKCYLRLKSSSLELFYVYCFVEGECQLPCAEDAVADRWTCLPAPGWGPPRYSAVEGPVLTREREGWELAESEDKQTG